MSSNIDTCANNKPNSDKLIEIEYKVDLLLERHDSTQKAIAHLRGDLPTIIDEIIKAILSKRSSNGYSKVSC